MSETSAITFTHKEVVEALIKKENLHDGIWQLSVEFGLLAINSQIGEQGLLPSAIIPIQRFGLTKVDKENPLAVDASKVNPKQ